MTRKKDQRRQRAEAQVKILYEGSGLFLSNERAAMFSPEKER